MGMGGWLPALALWVGALRVDAEAFEEAQGFGGVACGGEGVGFLGEVEQDAAAREVAVRGGRDAQEGVVVVLVDEADEVAVAGLEEVAAQDVFGRDAGLG